MVPTAYQPREVFRATEAWSWSCLAVVRPAQAEAITNAISKIAKTVRGPMSAPEVRSPPAKSIRMGRENRKGRELLRVGGVHSDWKARRLKMIAEPPKRRRPKIGSAQQITVRRFPYLAHRTQPKVE
jgi:hypothetical protein